MCTAKNKNDKHCITEYKLSKEFAGNAHLEIVIYIFILGDTGTILYT